jgi:hypothetical protein
MLRVRNSNSVIASEAKQSIVLHKASLIASSLSLLAMTNAHTSAFSRRMTPELCQKISAHKTEGVGNAGCQAHPQPRVRMG